MFLESRSGGLSLYATGRNSFGQLGLGDTADRNTFTVVGSGYTAIAAGTFHSLALKGTDLYATGYNGFGELGLGDNAGRNTFPFVGSGYTAIAAGDFHSLALKA